MQTLKVFGLAAFSLLAVAADAPAQPVTPATSPLTLEQAIGLARAQSPRLAAADALATAAADARRHAGTLLNHGIEVSTENWAATDAVPLDVFALFSQPFELGGKRRLRREAAAADVVVASATRDDMARQVIGAAVAGYVHTLRTRDALVLLGEQRADAAELVAIMRRRVDEGTAAEAELRKLETEVARVDTLIVRARIAARTAEEQFAVLVGEPAAGLSARLVAPPPMALPPAVSVGAAIERRADVQAARARAAAAEARLALEQQRSTPDLRLSGGYKRTANQNTGVASVSLTLPLWDRNGAAVARAMGDSRAATLEATLIERVALAEARTSVEAAGELAARAGEVEQALLAPAAVTRLAARASFRESGGDLLRLIDAERVYSDARLEALDLRLDALLAAVHARLAVAESLP